MDTDIFIYSIDSTLELGRKREIARELVKEHIENESGVISIQVVQEFYQVATLKIQKPIPVEDALRFMQFMSNMDVVVADFDMVIAAVHLHRKYNISFWDACRLQKPLTARLSSLKTFRTRSSLTAWL